MRWPGKIPADTVSFEVAGTIDLLPTIARLAGAGVPDDRVIDGKDVWPLMNGTADARTPHNAYFYYQGNQLEAVRSGSWKLRRVGAAALNDVQENIADSRDLAKSHPDIHRGLLDAIDNLDAAELQTVQEKASQMKDVAPKHRELIQRVADKFNNVNEVQLFNLQQDVSETRNLAEKHPDIVRRLTDTMNRFDRDLKANARPAAQREEE
jgi:arylsulfatase A-like enzyme